jgi:hypothetical protein
VIASFALAPLFGGYKPAEADKPEAPVVVASPVTAAPIVTEPAPVVTEPAPEPVAAVEAPVTTTAPVEVAIEEVALMPDVVGMNLQDAQDLIQGHGVFLSLSEDATGQGRMQVIDSNWVVVGQNIEPGQPFGEGEAVLSVVKYTD